MTYEVQRAIINGFCAGLNDRPQSECPYKGDLRRAWLKAYAEAQAS